MIYSEIDLVIDYPGHVKGFGVCLGDVVHEAICWIRSLEIR
jgi:hypothetical protein